MLVIYQSKTGFTQKYAQWIGEALKCEVKELKKISKEEVLKNDVIIYGGWVMGGMVSGLEELRKFNPSKLVVFAVGFSKKGEKDDDFAQANKVPKGQFFYMEGGLNPKKMGVMGRFMVKMVTKETPVYTDHTDKANINSLIEYIKGIQ